MTRLVRTLAGRPHRRSLASITAAAIVGASMVVGSWPTTATHERSQRTPMVLDQVAPSTAPIPVTSLAGLGALDATVTITADGTVDGKPTQGDLTAALTTNDDGRSKVEVTGSLLGDVVAQVGGSALKLFRPDRLSLYAVPEGTYAVLSSLLEMCVVPEDATTAGALDQLSPQRLLTTLTSSDVARGTFLGDETLNGMPVKHYLVDGDTFLTAARASSDPDLSAFAGTLRSVSDADLYVAADTGYPVAYRGGFSGAFEPLSFDGDLTVSAELTSVGANTPVTLPGACAHPISR